MAEVIVLKERADEIAHQMREVFKKIVADPGNDQHFTDFAALRAKLIALGYDCTILAYRNKDGEVTKMQLAVSRLRPVQH